MKPKGQPQKVGAILDGMLREAGYYSFCKEHEAIYRWTEISGPRLAEVTECERVENGVLYVRVISAPWRQELSYMKQELLGKIKMTTGCSTIREIVFL